MTRLLLTASALAAAIAVAAGPGKAPPHESSLPAHDRDAPCVCATETDGGRPRPHGLLMVADLTTEAPCVQGG